MSIFDTANPDDTIAMASTGPCVLTRQLHDYCTISNTRLAQNTPLTIADAAFMIATLAAVIVGVWLTRRTRRFLQSLLSP